MATEQHPSIRTRAPARSLPIARLLLALTLAAVGVWLVVHDRPKLNRETSLRDQVAELEQRIVQLKAKSDALAAEIPNEQSRVAQSEKVIRELTDLQSTWNLVTGNKAQQRANEERMQRMEALHATSVARVASLQQELAHVHFESESLKAQQTRIESELRLEQARQNGLPYKAGRVWLRVRGWLCLVLSLGVVAWMIRSRSSRRRPRSNAEIVV